MTHQRTLNSYDATRNPVSGTPVRRDVYTPPSATETGRTISLPPSGGDLGERIIWALD